MGLELGACQSLLQKRKNVRFYMANVIWKRNGDIFQWGGRQVKKTAIFGRFLDLGGSRWKIPFLSNVPLMPQDCLVPFLDLLRHFCNWEIFFEGICRPYFGTLGPSEGSWWPFLVEKMGFLLHTIDIWPLGGVLVHLRTCCFCMIFDGKGYIWVFWYFGWEHLGGF